MTKMKKHSKVHTKNSDLFLALEKSLSADPFWDQYLCKVLQEKIHANIHLAIFIEPYLQYILEGKKTIESRFSVKKGIPYKRVFTGDVVLLKRSGGPIIGVSLVSNAWCYVLDSRSWKEIKSNYATRLCAQDPNFWKDRKSASYATLISISNVTKISPVEFQKRDRRGWMILQPTVNQLDLL